MEPSREKKANERKEAAMKKIRTADNREASVFRTEKVVVVRYDDKETRRPLYFSSKGRYFAKIDGEYNQIRMTENRTHWTLA